MKLKTSVILKLLIVPLLPLLFFVSNTYAQEKTLSIGCAPTVETLQLELGEEYNGEGVFWNLSEEPITYSIVVRGFKQIENQPGTAIILTEEENEQSLYSASSWIELKEESITLIPNKNQKIYYKVTVPEDITKGEYHAIIFLVSEDEEVPSGTVTMNNLGSGIPILIKVGDEFVENAELLNFVTDKNFYEKADIFFYTKIKNLGDTHITPSGEIVLENIFKQEIARIPFNENKQSLLRDNIGNYEDRWIWDSLLGENKRIIAFGPITANLIVTYRTYQPGFAPLTAQAKFWIIPWKLILAILATIIAIIVINRLRKKKNPYGKQTA